MNDAAKLVRRVARHRSMGGTVVGAARRFGLTVPAVMAILDSLDSPPAEPEPPPVVDDEPAPVRDMAADPVDDDEALGWSALIAAGWTVGDVAADAEVPPALVRALTRGSSTRTRDGRPMEVARRDPRMRLLLPVGPLTPHGPCPHKGPIPRGEKTVCLVCHASGLDGLDLPHVGTAPPPPDIDDADDDRSADAKPATPSPSMGREPDGD